MPEIIANVSGANAPTFAHEQLRVGHLYQNVTSKDVVLVVRAYDTNGPAPWDKCRKALVYVGSMEERAWPETARYTWVGELQIGSPVEA